MKKSLSVLSLLTGIALFAGCGGDDNETRAPSTTTPTGSNTTASASVPTKVAGDVMGATMSEFSGAMGTAAGPRQRATLSKATMTIETNEGTVHVVVTFNDPIAVSNGSAVLTGTMTMDMQVSSLALTADVQMDITATFSNATLTCEDGAHVVDGAFRITGPMEVHANLTAHPAVVSANWTWTMTSVNLTIDGVAYDVDLVYDGSLVMPGTLHATLIGTVNGQQVSETISENI